VDGLLGKEAKILLRKLSAMLAEKWEKPCSEVCGYVNCSYEHCHCQSNPSLHPWIAHSDGQNVQPPEDKAGLGLFRH
jgi:hypothetical protein